jgi:hypothetical protein
MRTMQFFQPKSGRRVTASVNMTGSKKARHEAGLFVALIGSTDQMMSRYYCASLAICAVRRETLRLALFL